MDNKEFLNGWFQDFVENFGTNVWKIAPFRVGNRMWLAVLLKAYVACILSCVVLACVINSIEGKRWLVTDVNGKAWSRARGDGANGALDECIWFVVTTVHGIGFGEFVSHGPARWVSMVCISLGYWFQIFLCSIVMLSQLPGERIPSLYGATARIVSAVWPSYLVFMLIMIAVGSTLEGYISKHQWNAHLTGPYFAWQVAHRMPFGDIFPTTPYGRVMTCVLAIMGLLYMPYALALVAVRCPTLEEHENLLGRLRKNPDAALGRGYIAPRDGNNMREIVMQEYTPEPVC